MDVKTAKKFIQKDQPQKAIAYLMEICLYQEGHKRFLDDLSVLSAELKRHQKEISQLRLRKDEGDFNQINHAILQLINEMIQYNPLGKEVSSKARMVDATFVIPTKLARQKGEILIQDYHFERFPILDFKLQNTSQENLLLHRFHLELIDFELDRKPELKFNFTIIENKDKPPKDRGADTLTIYGDLAITVTNNGWGEARDCNIEIKAPILSQFFKLDPIQWAGNISANATQTIALIESNKKKRRVWKKVFLEQLKVNYTYQDEDKVRYTNDVVATLSPSNTRTAKYQAFLSQKGFALQTDYLHTSGKVIKPEALYIALFEPEKTRKSYTISHSIPAKGFERFQIMLGAPQSASIKAKIGFELSEGAPIWTQVLHLKVHNPAHIAYHKKFYDAGEFVKKEDNWILFGKPSAYER